METNIRFSSRLDSKLISISVLAFVLIAILAADAILDLIELKQLARTQIRDARQANLNAAFDVALVRAAGEAASYVTTGNRAYLTEASDSIERAETGVGYRLRDNLEEFDYRNSANA